MDTKNASCVKVLHARMDARMDISELQGVVNVIWIFATNVRLERVIFRGIHVQLVATYCVGTALIWLRSKGRLKFSAVEREDILYPYHSFCFLLSNILKKCLPTNFL